MSNSPQKRVSLSDDEIYRLLVESITDYAIYMLSPSGTVSSWNPGAERLKGYRAEEIIGRHFSTFYTEEDRASGLPERALHIAAEAGKFESEGWRIRKDGTRFWAYVVIDPIRTAHAELAGFAKITRDLTERRLAEEALRKSEEQFRLLVQGVTDYAIFMLSPEGVVHSWNAGAEHIKGYAPEEIIGQHFSRFYTPEDIKSGLPKVALETAAREGRFENEGKRVRKDGSTFWAHVIIDAVRTSAGTLIGFAKITRDVTVQREARRTLELTRETLFQAQKMDAVGQLTGGVAHDFNNLLTAILGSLELLRKRLPDDAKSRMLLNNAEAGARRGAALTQRMLAFARRQELDVAAVDIPGLVKGMSELLERSVGPSYEMEIRFPLKLSPVETDANQLELALLNLVVNARDAMPAGGNIVIAARENAADAEREPWQVPGVGYICLSVTDHGHGMDDRTLARAPEPFFTTKGIGKGTGLGLPMVHGLAEQSGGKLVLKSQVGKGTTAELWLRASSRVVKAHAPARIAQTAADRVPRRILTVDDDSLVLSNTAAMLEDLGHTVIEASSADRALDILANQVPVDLVITDHAMPNMTGAELSEQIRARWPTLPIIIATGYAEWPPGIAEQLIKLPKPFDQEDLAVAVATATHDKG